jgi:hypothetical protein
MNNQILQEEIKENEQDNENTPYELYLVPLFLY